jgi:protease YdgD
MGRTGRRVPVRSGTPEAIKVASSFMLRHLIIAIGGLVGALGPATSQELQPGIIGSDNRIAVVSDAPPWNSIGHVNIDGYRRVVKCSGVLVQPNVVLTAAHCVIDPRTHTGFPPHRIHFVQNVHGTRMAGHAKAECLRFLSNYQPGSGDVQDLLPRRQRSVQHLARDVVAIVLADPLAVDSIPLLDLHDINLGLGLVHASYPADRRYRLMADFQCRLISTVQHLWITDCDTHPASSGGPIFARVGDILKLGAIVVGGAQKRVTLAVPATEWAELARGLRCTM